MKITEDIRKYAAEQGITEEAAIGKGLKQKATEFNEAGAESTRRLNVREIARACVLVMAPSPSRNLKS